MNRFEDGGSFEDGEHDEWPDQQSEHESVVTSPEMRSSDEAIDLARTGKYQTLEDRRGELIERKIFSPQDFNLLMINALGNAIDSILVAIGQVDRQLGAIQRVIPDAHTEEGGKYELEQLVLALNCERERLAKELEIKDESWEAVAQQVSQMAEKLSTESDSNIS